VGGRRSSAEADTPEMKRKKIKRETIWGYFVEEEIGTKFVFTIHLNGSQKIIGGLVQNINKADESQDNFAGVSEKVPEFGPPQAGPTRLGIK